MGPRFECWHGEEVFFYLKSSRPSLEPTRSPIQWVPGLKVKRSGRDMDHALPFSADVKNEWSRTSTPLYLHDVQFFFILIAIVS